MTYTMISDCHEKKTKQKLEVEGVKDKFCKFTFMASFVRKDKQHNIQYFTQVKH